MNWTLPPANAEVTAQKRDTDAECAKLGEQVVRLVCIVQRKAVLWAAVCCADCLRDLCLFKYIIEPVGVWILGCTEACAK